MFARTKAFNRTKRGLLWLHRDRLNRGTSRLVQRGVEFFERPAPGFESKQYEDDTGERIPSGEVNHRRLDRRDCRLRTDHIRRANDQRQPERSEDLTKIADAKTETHAARPKS